MGRWAASPSTRPSWAWPGTADGGGYWEVAADGGIFSFGDAVFHGSMGGRALNAPIVGMAAARGGGYWEVASDGGSSAWRALLRLPCRWERDRFFAMVPTPGGAGYLLAGQHPAD